MNLTKETAKLIQPGHVVRFTYLNGHTDTGVVYANDHLGIKCNKEAHCHFGFGPQLINLGVLKFEIIKDHSPVKIYNDIYDFVSNHVGFEFA